jgi:hypothetical protein
VQLRVTPVQIIIYFIGAHFGLVAVAFGAILCWIIEFVPSQIAVNRIACITMRDLGKAVTGSLVIAGGSAILPLVVLASVSSSKENIIPMMVLASLGALIGWFSTVTLLRHPVSVEVKSAFKHLRLQLGRLSKDHDRAH